MQRTQVATVAAVLASAFVAFPYLLLDFGTLYPNGLAYTILPAGLGLVAAALPFPGTASWRPEAAPARWRTGLLLLAGPPPPRVRAPSVGGGAARARRAARRGVVRRAHDRARGER